MQTWQIVLLTVSILVVLSAVVSRRYPPIGTFVECDGVRLHYLDRGNQDGPVLVLLHGNGMMVQDFVISGVLNDAGRRYRVLCFDRPGFGHSTRPRRRSWTPEAEAELFAAALRRLGVERAIVVGHSWGTLVTVALGLRFPELVQGLVLASGYYFPTWRTDVWLLSAPAVPVVGDLMRYTISPLLSWLMMPKLLGKMFEPGPVPDRFLREFPLLLTVRPLHLRAAAEETALMIPAAARLQHRYAELTCPAALIVGDSDQVVDPGQTAQLHRALERSVVRSVPTAGHMVHHAAPDRMLDTVELIFAWPNIHAEPIHSLR